MTAILLWLGLLGAAAPPRFGTETETVRLDVVATHGGRPLLDLRAEDFVVVDNGIPQRVDLVSRGADQGLHAVLAVDVSSSVRGDRLDHLKAATLAFLDGLEPTDHATLLSFSDEVRRPAPPGHLALTRQAVAGLSPGGSTAIFDALFAALKTTEAAPGRPLVLVFSDGCDRLSWMKGETVARLALDLDAMVYFVRAGETLPGEDPLRSVDAVEKIARDTGGRSFVAEHGLEKAFLQVLAEAKNRYLLSYEPQGVAQSGFHTLKVRLKKRGGQVRARRGYHKP